MEGLTVEAGAPSAVEVFVRWRPFAESSRSRKRLSQSCWRVEKNRPNGLGGAPIFPILGVS